MLFFFFRQDLATLSHVSTLFFPPHAEVCFKAAFTQARFAIGNDLNNPLRVNLVMVGTSTSNTLTNTVCACDHVNRRPGGPDFCEDILKPGLAARLAGVRVAIESGQI